MIPPRDLTIVYGGIWYRCPRNCRGKRRTTWWSISSVFFFGAEVWQGSHNLTLFGVRWYILEIYTTNRINLSTASTITLVPSPFPSYRSPLIPHLSPLTTTNTPKEHPQAWEVRSVVKVQSYYFSFVSLRKEFYPCLLTAYEPRTGYVIGAGANIPRWVSCNKETRGMEIRAWLWYLCVRVDSLCVKCLPCNEQHEEGWWRGRWKKNQLGERGWSLRLEFHGGLEDDEYREPCTPTVRERVGWASAHSTTVRWDTVHGVCASLCLRWSLEAFLSFSGTVCYIAVVLITVFSLSVCLLWWRKPATILLPNLVHLCNQLSIRSMIMFR